MPPWIGGRGPKTFFCSLSLLSAPNQASMIFSTASCVHQAAGYSLGDTEDHVPGPLILHQLDVVQEELSGPEDGGITRGKKPASPNHL